MEIWQMKVTNSKISMTPILTSHFFKSRGMRRKSYFSIQYTQIKHKFIAIYLLH